MSMSRDLPSMANMNDGRFGPGAPGHLGESLPRSPAEALQPMRPPEPPPEWEEPEPNQHPFLGMLDGFVTFIFLLVCFAAAVFFWVRLQIDRPGPLTTSAVFAVPRGEGGPAIAERLEREGIIADRGIFMASLGYFKYFKGLGSPKAGEYQFPKHATMREVLDTLVEGKSIQYKITLAEGLTSYQIVQKLMAHPELHGEITEIPPEGSLLPDTYKFGRNDTRQNIIERMHAAQTKFLAKVWPGRDQDIVVTTPEEAVTLASIVEKETGRADERPRIASVFQNRLRKKMRLQSDPTIIYGLVGGKAVLDHPIQRDEIDRETAYNTYKINGLPPTPIANPGRAAIEAVLRPAKTNDLYFVADGTGGHIFSSTLNEHNKNVAEWRKVEREIRAREAQQAAAKAALEAAAPQDQASPSASGAPPAGTITSQVLVDPAALANTGQSLAEPDSASGDTVPKPLRNPKR
jgi:peptidoglycan lytic transglycosylase G